MGDVPERPAIARGYRALLDILERFIPIPRIHPSWWSLLGLIGSVACLYVASAEWKLVLVSAVLITDWYDGATARKLGTTSREGYIVDVVIDRFSESFIFLADVGTTAGKIFFLLWILNTALTLWGAAKGVHRILPLRFAWLFVLAYWVVT